jgi:hypothetical protein
MAFFDASYPYETFCGAMIMPIDWIKRIKWRETVSLVRGTASTPRLAVAERKANIGRKSNTVVPSS